MTESENARYTFEFDATMQEYVDFNLYTGMQSPQAKKIILKMQSKYAIRTTCGLILFAVNNIRPISEAMRSCINYLVCIYFVINLIDMIVKLSPKFMRKRMERKSIEFAEKEKNAYAKHAVVSFYENRVRVISEIKEEVFLYDRITRCHIGDNAIYINLTPVTAYILPVRTIPKEDAAAFNAFLRDKLPEGTEE